jgi:flagellar biosynthesis protein FlhB
MSSSEGGDSGERTEDATERRIERAFEGGEFTFPRDTFIFAHIVCGLVIFTLAPGMLIALKPSFFRFADIFGREAPPGEAIGALTKEALIEITMALAPMLGAFLLTTLLIGFGQQGFKIVFRPIKASLSNVSPMSGIKRIFGPQALFTNGLNLAKLVILTAVVASAAAIFATPRALYGNLAATDVLPRRAISSLSPLLVSAAVALLVFAAVDYGVKYFQNRSRLRMTKQEIKEEYKESEGDPKIKAQLAKLRQQRRQGSSYKLREADMVLVNPTHYAVALKYVADKHAAPIVIAKGAGSAAGRIRTEAREWSIPVLRYPEVTRALFFQTGLDQEVPETLFEEIARILVLVMNMRRPGRF